jgi:hypothetical protein
VLEGQDGALKDPLIVASLGFIIGAFYGIPARPIATTIGAAALLLLIAGWRKRRGSWPPLFVFGAAMLISSLCVSFHLALERPLGVIRGTIAEVPDRTPYGTVAIVELDHGTRVRLTITSTAGEAPRYGARLEAPDVEFAVPDGADVPRFRSKSPGVRRGVAASGSTKKVRVLEPARAVRAQVASFIGEPTLAAIALSERGLADPAREEALVLGGHSFAFSLGGASMIFMSLGAFVLLARRLPVWGAVSIAAGLTVACAALQDFTPSTLRVAATIAVALGYSVYFGKPALRRSIPFSIILVLGFDPAALGDTYYQLAVAVLTASVAIYPAFARFAPRTVRPLIFLAALAVSTAPLLTRQFDRITLLSLAGNMIALPALIGVVIPFSWLTPVASGALWLVEALSVDPAAAIATPTMLECALFYLAMLSFAAKPATRRTQIFAAASSVALIAAVIVSFAMRETEHHAVLPGGFTVIQRPGEGLLVQSTGERSADPERGTRVLDLYLKKHRLTAIDTLKMPRPDRAVEAAIHRQREVRKTIYGDH